MFTPTRDAGLAALAAFIPGAGRQYAQLRNHDTGAASRTNVSVLSPYIRHRLITEREVVEAVLERHSAQAAEKFVQEVFWRTYWKGWLELRPSVWHGYVTDLRMLVDEIPTAEWSDDYATACAAQTGIDCFDAWISELADEGYLHNHARMWFASIWIFTLRLPWQLGADLFYRQLVDGDAASNTLSWRWVAGLQTPGKTYLARADNISTYTDGRFRPHGLATHATALVEGPIPEAGPLALPDPVPEGRIGLLLHEEDLHPESLVAGAVAVAGIHRASERSPLQVTDNVAAFTRDAIADGVARAAGHFGAPGDVLDAAAIGEWAAANDIDRIVTPYAPTGPVQSRLGMLRRELLETGVTLSTVRREWDSLAWPNARRGFFPFRERIPRLLAEQGIVARR